MSKANWGKAVCSQSNSQPTKEVGGQPFRAIQMIMSLQNTWVSCKLLSMVILDQGYPLLFNEVSRLSGVEHVHPHRWRRSAATRFLQNNNGNIATLMKMLGHQDAAMSLHYLRISDDQLAKAVREHSNVDSLRMRRNK